MEQGKKKVSRCLNILSTAQEKLDDVTTLSNLIKRILFSFPRADPQRVRGGRGGGG